MSRESKNMQIILSTRNLSKALQIGNIFKGTVFQIKTLDETNIEGEGIEDGTTLEENALKKAWYAYANADSDYITMADDTGLFIEALNGEPGIRAARWAGDQATTEDITAYTLKKLKGIRNRKATFRTAVAIVLTTGDKYYFSGEINGTILEKPRVPAQPKMPYSGIFLPDGSNKVWAEMTVEEENAISHRGIAFRAAKKWLESIQGDF